MVKVHCSGCGRSEPSGRRDKIQPVTLTIASDHPTRSWEQEESYTEDICTDCVEQIVRTFFGVKIAGEIVPPILLAARHA